MFSREDCAHMARALQLAARGQLLGAPKPDGGLCARQRWRRRRRRMARARRRAARRDQCAARAGERPGARSRMSSLEPCAHHGKTPPCATALIEAGVSKVIAAMQDPFDEVAGRGIEALRANGIEAEVGLMQSAAEALNAAFISRVTRGRPFVRLKIAASLDGAIAMESGESQWITRPEAREDVQRLRARSGCDHDGHWHRTGRRSLAERARPRTLTCLATSRCASCSTVGCACR